MATDKNLATIDVTDERLAMAKHHAFMLALVIAEKAAQRAHDDAFAKAYRLALKSIER
jgi:hypothetical protein